MATTSLSMMTVSRSKLMTKFSTTVNCALISKWPILTYTVTLPSASSRFFDGNTSDGCTSFKLFSNKLMNMKHEIV